MPRFTLYLTTAPVCGWTCDSCGESIAPYDDCYRSGCAYACLDCAKYHERGIANWRLVDSVGSHIRALRHQAAVKASHRN